jgi:hypothetical protein
MRGDGDVHGVRSDPLQWIRGVGSGVYRWRGSRDEVRRILTEAARMARAADA